EGLPDCGSHWPPTAGWRSSRALGSPSAAGSKSLLRRRGTWSYMTSKPVLPATETCRGTQWRLKRPTTVRSFGCCNVNLDRECCHQSLRGWTLRAAKQLTQSQHREAAMWSKWSPIDLSCSLANLNIANIKP